ncbi:MAG: hypothetical protein NT154_21345, partial [Verrucomicrobia bacterium]|nr:hypothetical protein [Verrucomicrobiota bacterium]
RSVKSLLRSATLCGHILTLLSVRRTSRWLVWDYYTGWLPPRTGSGSPYMVWGKTEYAKGDHQIDMLFRSLFPHYEDCAYFLDERGFLTVTPYGDIFDSLLSNVPRYVLNQYDVAAAAVPSSGSPPRAFADPLTFSILLGLIAGRNRKCACRNTNSESGGCGLIQSASS